MKDIFCERERACGWPLDLERSLLLQLAARMLSMW